jgi:predicted ATP-grasp superfamily ATP-dependent carboligase
VTAGADVPVVIVGLGMTGLGVVRSLAPCGMPLIAVDTLPRKASARTRLCRKVLVDPGRGESLWEAVERVGREHPARPVLIPTSDVAVLETSRRRDALEPLFRFRLPDAAQVDVLMDKTAFAAFAEREGLPVPRTFSVSAGRGWERVLDACRFPCLVKPKYRSPAWVAAGLTKVFRAADADDLRGLLARLGRVEDDFVVQEWIPGNDADVFFHLAYYDGASQPRVAFTGRKLRQWPPLLGSTTLAEAAESAEVDAEARRLFARVGFRGLGSVEFKRDARDGRFKITEATVGRPNLQSEVSTANGVNIVHEAYRELTGAPPAAPARAARNVRWIFVDNDLSSALHYWRRGELTLGAWRRSWRAPRYYADFCWTDPLPFLAQAGRVLRGALRRLVGSRAAAGDDRQLN